MGGVVTVPGVVQHLLTVDSRGRVPITKVSREGDTHYLATSSEDGVITLTPAVVMPKQQAEFMAGPDRALALKQAMTGEVDLVDLDADLSRSLDEAAGAADG